MSSRSPIAIVGISCLFPGSDGSAAFWRNIIAGSDLISDVPPSRWRIDHYRGPVSGAPVDGHVRRGGFLSKTQFCPVDFAIPPNTVSAIDTAQLLGLVVASQVLDDATGGDYASLDRDRISVVLGVASGTELLVHMGAGLELPVWEHALRSAGLPEPELKEFSDRIAASYLPWQEDSFPGLLANVVAGRIANRLDFGGTNCVVDAACASSLAAVDIASNELYSGNSDMVIAGGVDTFNDALMFKCFSEVTALSQSGDCRPFSADADGTMLGEGLAMFALRRLADAERDGDRIYSVIRGIGSSSDGRARSIYAPSSPGQVKALRRAYAAAGYGPETVGLVEAHGTGTKAGDTAEFSALRDVFTGTDRAELQWCALGSVKSQIGHTKAAAGAAGLFKAAMALHHKVVPPTIKVDRPNPSLRVEDSPFYLPAQPKPWLAPVGLPRRASVSSFGFGGTNFHVTLEEYTGSGKRAWRHRASSCELILVTAESAERLAADATELCASLVEHPDMLSHLARETQERYDATQQHRLALVADNLPDLKVMLTQAAARLRAAGCPRSFDSSPGYFYSREPSGPVALLFPGQGSQYVGMGTDVPLVYAGALDPWELSRRAMGNTAPALHEIVWPATAYSESEQERQSQILAGTQWAQPAIGSHSLSLLTLIRALNIKYAMAGGHSFGEVIALCAAGVFSDEAALAIAHQRGLLMANAAEAAQGAMSAVSAPIERTISLISSWGLQVAIANHNSPNQIVLAGRIDAIVEAENRLRAEGLAPQRLNVATAFHSDVVDSAVGPLEKFLAGIEFSPPSVPVYANAAAQPYKPDTGSIRQGLANQLAQPVHFSQQVDHMWGAGARIFVEVGPDAVLTRLVRECLGDKRHTAVALDRRGSNGIRTLWQGLAQLAAAGVSMDFAALWADYREVDDPRHRKPPALALMIDGGNYGLPQPDVGSTAPTATPAYHPHAADDEPLQLQSEESAQSGLQSVVEPPLCGGGVARSDVDVDVAGAVLGVVADKTGYPVEMLDLSMSLESDLGIDSIKRVEILAAVQQRMPSVGEVDAAVLGAGATLREVVDRLGGRASSSVAAPATVESDMAAGFAVRSRAAPVWWWRRTLGCGRGCGGCGVGCRCGQDWLSG
ncbi:type I polyketide synthase [Mycobacterium simiae]|nr:type I polyketide synthase [Mycobacterium simiae]